MGQPSREPPTVEFTPRAHPFPAFLVAVVAIAIGIQGVTELVRARRLAELGFAGARWIWIAKSPDRGPVHFSAVREFSLPDAPRAAEARIFVDRRFQLWINGSRAGEGGQSPGDAPARIEVGPLLRKGRNSAAIVAESPAGIGGILFALAPAGGPPIVVSDRTWSIDPTGLALVHETKARAIVLGRPPMHPWRWPSGAATAVAFGAGSVRRGGRGESGASAGTPAAAAAVPATSP